MGSDGVPYDSSWKSGSLNDEVQYNKLPLSKRPASKVIMYC